MSPEKRPTIPLCVQKAAYDRDIGEEFTPAEIRDSVIAMGRKVSHRKTAELLEDMRCVSSSDSHFVSESLEREEPDRRICRECDHSRSGSYGCVIGDEIIKDIYFSENHSKSTTEPKKVPLPPKRPKQFTLPLLDASLPLPRLDNRLSSKLGVNPPIATCIQSVVFAMPEGEKFTADGVSRTLILDGISVGRNSIIASKLASMECVVRVSSGTRPAQFVKILRRDDTCVSCDHRANGSNGCVINEGSLRKYYYRVPEERQV